MGTIYIVCASVLWCALHSILASNQIKYKVHEIFGALAFDRLYRLSYNIFALATFFPIVLMLISFPDQIIYRVSSPWVYATTLVQGLAFFVLVAGVMRTGLMEFAGVAQLIPYSRDAKPAQLVTDGLYELVRHPIYTAGLVFIWFSAEMTINWFVLWITFTVYIVIGAYFEESKLIKVYGSVYTEYKSRTPMFFPDFLKIHYRKK